MESGLFSTWLIKSLTGEIVRTLVGSLGLVSAVPVTTALAALIVES